MGAALLIRHTSGSVGSSVSSKNGGGTGGGGSKSSTLLKRPAELVHMTHAEFARRLSPQISNMSSSRTSHASTVTVSSTKTASVTHLNHSNPGSNVDSSSDGSARSDIVGNKTNKKRRRVIYNLDPSDVGSNGGGGGGGYTGPWGRLNIDSDSDQESSDHAEQGEGDNEATEDTHSKTLDDHKDHDGDIDIDNEDKDGNGEDDREERRRITSAFMAGDWIHSVPSYLRNYIKRDDCTSRESKDMSGLRRGRRCRLSRRCIFIYPSPSPYPYPAPTAELAQITRSAGNVGLATGMGVTCALFVSETCHLVLAGYGDGQVRLWDLYHKRQLLSTYHSTDTDSQVLDLSKADNANKEEMESTGSVGSVVSICSIKCGETVFALYSTGIVRGWTTHTAAPIDTLNLNNLDSKITAICSFRDSLILIGDEKGCVKMYDPISKTTSDMHSPSSSSSGESPIVDMQISKDSSVLMTLDANSIVYINHCPLNDSMMVFMRDSSHIVNACLDPTGALVALQMSDDQLLVFDVTHIPPISNIPPISSISHNGEKGNNETHVEKVNLEKPKRLLGHSTQTPPLRPCFSADSRYIVLGNTFSSSHSSTSNSSNFNSTSHGNRKSDVNEIVFWNVDSCKIEQRLDIADGGSCRGCVWNGCDVNKMVSYHSTGEIKLWQS